MKEEQIIKAFFKEFITKGYSKSKRHCIKFHKLREMLEKVFKRRFQKEINFTLPYLEPTLLGLGYTMRKSDTSSRIKQSYIEPTSEFIVIVQCSPTSIRDLTATIQNRKMGEERRKKIDDLILRLGNFKNKCFD